MKLKALALALSVGAACVAGGANAITITNTDGTLPFSGFDWAQGGTAFTTGFVPTAGNTFTLTYFAWATALQAPSGGGFQNFVPPGMDTDANGAPGGLFSGSAYEYTIAAVLQETVSSCSGTVCTFDVTGGNFTVWYDTTPDANANAGAGGTGFVDGTPIIQGTVFPLAGQTFNTVSGSNATTLQGAVTFTNGAFITPPLSGTTATTTLQIGNAVTNWVNPGGFAGAPFTANTTFTTNTVFQADGNQSFRAVPEPGSLALLGLGLAALPYISRRRRDK